MSHLVPTNFDTNYDSFIYLFSARKCLDEFQKVLLSFVMFEPLFSSMCAAENRNIIWCLSLSVIYANKSVTDFSLF